MEEEDYIEPSRTGLRLDLSQVLSKIQYGWQHSVQGQQLPLAAIWKDSQQCGWKPPELVLLTLGHCLGYIELCPPSPTLVSLSCPNCYPAMGISPSLDNCSCSFYFILI